MTTEQYLEHWKERVEGVPHSAPAYDGFQVQDYPRPLCIISGTPDASRCRCYTQQATRLTIPDQLCRSYVENGIWDPYKAPAQPQQNAPSGTESPESAQRSAGNVAVQGVIPYQPGQRADVFPRNPATAGESYTPPTSTL